MQHVSGNWIQMFARFSTEMKGIEELKAMMIGKVSMFSDIQVLENRL
jgi:hypothetical protein